MEAIGSTKWKPDQQCCSKRSKRKQRGAHDEFIGSSLMSWLLHNLGVAGKRRNSRVQGMTRNPLP